jgi:Tetratricopeptide repeat
MPRRNGKQTARLRSRPYYGAMAMTHDTSELIARAMEARKEKNLPEAKRSWSEAVALCRQSGQRSELIRSLKGLAQIESDLGHGDDALPLYEEAVALCG